MRQDEAKLLDVQLLQTSLQFSSKTRNVILSALKGETGWERISGCGAVRIGLEWEVLPQQNVWSWGHAAGRAFRLARSANVGGRYPGRGLDSDREATTCAGMSFGTPRMSKSDDQRLAGLKIKSHLRVPVHSAVLRTSHFYKLPWRLTEILSSDDLVISLWVSESVPCASLYRSEFVIWNGQIACVTCQANWRIKDGDPGDHASDVETWHTPGVCICRTCWSAKMCLEVSLSSNGSSVLGAEGWMAMKSTSVGCLKPRHLQIYRFYQVFQCFFNWFMVLPMAWWRLAPPPQRELLRRWPATHFGHQAAVAAAGKLRFPGPRPWRFDNGIVAVNKQVTAVYSFNLDLVLYLTAR